jgi:hypothetical protein
MTTDLDSTDPGFVEDFLASDEAVWAVARRLRLKGHTVHIPPIRIRKRAQDRAEFMDNGDLRAFKLGKPAFTVEVKQRLDFDFSGKLDYPFPTVFVDNVHHWDAMRPVPAWVFVCNLDLTVALVVSGLSRPTWTIRRFKDRGRTRQCYECPMKHVTEVSLDVWEILGVPRPGSRPDDEDPEQGQLQGTA